MLAAVTLVAADAKEEVTSAAKKLAGADGYSWKSTSESTGGGGGGGGRGRLGPTEGKAAKDGTTYLSMERGDNTFEVVVKGEKGAFKGQEGWQSFAEAGEGEGRGRFIGAYRNYKAPAAEAQELAAKAKDLKKDGDAYTGQLDAEAVKGLISRGRANAEATGSKGSVKFWVKDGMLSKYEYNVQGTITANNNEREVNRTTVVEIKDVGKTKIELPEEAKKKIS